MKIDAAYAARESKSKKVIFASCSKLSSSYSSSRVELHKDVVIQSHRHKLSLLQMSVAMTKVSVEANE